ncbi:MAG: methyltransferase domain-containing protein [Kiritimatiellales bacterium]|jgi:23S rRNA (guanine745-N1)-methyltransferase
MKTDSTLICPSCESPLNWGEKECRCASGHSFDLAKEGYTNLLLSHQRRSSHPGDDDKMIQARRRFFDSGAFDLVTEQIKKSAIGNHQSAILDCGCGEGHFLGALSENVRTPPRSGSVGDVAPPSNPAGRASLSERAGQFFGVDVSKEAVRCAAKRYKKAKWIVANGMRKLPFADHSLDVILSVLAPRNPEEFARILKPDGALILGVPGPNHLIELRSRLSANAGDFEEKADEAAAKCAPRFKETHRDMLSYQQPLNAAQLADLIQMTPIFWCSSPEAKAEVQQLDQLTVTVSFVLLTLQPEQVERALRAR